MSSLNDTSKLLKALIAVQDEYMCINCRQYYPKKWCNHNSYCFYCTHFLPMRDTYKSILKYIEWYFIKSGESSRKEYYTAYLDNLQKWCNTFPIPPTKQDKKDEEELRNVED